MQFKNIREKGHKADNKFAETLCVGSKFDKEPFLRLFRKTIPKLSLLSNIPTYRLLFYVFHEVSLSPPGCDYICIEYDKVYDWLHSNTASKKDLKFKKSSFYRALSELKDCQVIAPIHNKQGEVFYYINPTVLFDGSRIKYADEIIKLSRTKHLQEIIKENKLKSRKVHELKHIRREIDHEIAEEESQANFYACIVADEEMKRRQQENKK